MVLGASWNIVTKFNCTYNCTYHHIRALKGLISGLIGACLLLSTTNLQVA